MSKILYLSTLLGRDIDDIIVHENGFETYLSDKDKENLKKFGLRLINPVLVSNDFVEDWPLLRRSRLKVDDSSSMLQDSHNVMLSRVFLIILNDYSHVIDEDNQLLVYKNVNFDVLDKQDIINVVAYRLNKRVEAISFDSSNHLCIDYTFGSVEENRFGDIETIRHFSGYYYDGHGNIISDSCYGLFGYKYDGYEFITPLDRNKRVCQFDSKKVFSKGLSYPNELNQDPLELVWSQEEYTDLFYVGGNRRVLPGILSTEGIENLLKYVSKPLGDFIFSVYKVKGTDYYRAKVL